MACALCLSEKRLCKSHIVPDFMFRRLYAIEHEFFVMKLSEGQSKKFNKTFCEKLLCLDCELQLSKWESHASNFFYGNLPLTGRPVGNHFLLKGADYRVMKLFLMSILWRFSVTTNPHLKGSLDLGPHQGRLRKLLFTSDPAEPWRYGCTITAIMLEGTHVPDLIVPPGLIKEWGQRIHRIVAGGFLFAFFASSHPPPQAVRATMLQEDGSFLLARGDLREIRYLSAVSQRAARIPIDSLSVPPIRLAK
jgi:hypothetical protein